MTASGQITRAQLDTLRWTASLGAVTAEALALRAGISPASARGRLLVLRRREMLSGACPLTGQPTLFTATRAGLAACRIGGIEPLRVSAREANHLIVCATAAAVLERGYPDHRLIGERELRRDEREHGVVLASSSLGRSDAGEARLHRPDLVLIARSSDRYEALPIAVEVELTVKSTMRLQAICRAWSRCRTIAGVLYLVSDVAERALSRALVTVSAQERIVVVPLSALGGIGEGTRRAVATRL